MTDTELEIKRLELVAKVTDSAIERQFKLATFTLAGNVAAIGVAATLAVKDHKSNDNVAGFGEAMFGLLSGQ